MKSIKLNNQEIIKFKNYTKTLKHETPHQYENIRIKDKDILLILYNSKKLVFNENRNIIHLLNKILDNKYKIETYSNYTKNKDNNSKINYFDFDYIIGSDETGKGEWFGPLVVTTTCICNNEIIKLKEIGVKDSKKLNRKDIEKIYNKIQKININTKTLILKPFQYNKLYETFQKNGKNLNHMLAYLHSKAITELLKNINPNKKVLIIIDKFDYKKMNEYLNINSNIQVIQESNGERYIPVATSSIIAKQNYEKTLHELEERYNIKLRNNKPKNINKEILPKVAKTHFKNIKTCL